MEYNTYYFPPSWHYRENGEAWYGATIGLKGVDGKYGQWVEMQEEEYMTPELVKEYIAIMKEQLDEAYSNDN